jgi:hypothetical protein
VRSRARSPRRYHPSSPVRVPRPAPSFPAAFRPHRAVTPWRFPGPAAPRTPGQETCTPKHDRMHGTHASSEARATPDHLPLAPAAPLWPVASSASLGGAARRQLRCLVNRQAPGYFRRTSQRQCRGARWPLQQQLQPQLLCRLLRVSPCRLGDRRNTSASPTPRGDRHK